MRIIKVSEIESESVAEAHLSGSARRRDLGRIDKPGASVMVVSFDSGARTYWHRHSQGQALYVLNGTGYVSARGGQTVKIRAGDFVYAPPGEEHWHGAAAAGPLTHIAVSFGETEWLEAVSEELIQPTTARTGPPSKR